MKFYFSPQEGAFNNNQVSREQPGLLVIIPYEDVKNLDQKTAVNERLYVEHPEFPVPTNQWFSSVAFTQASEPLFAYPLAVKMNDDGFGVSYPKIVSTSNTVFASYDPDMRIIFKKKDLNSSVGSYDDLSVDIVQKKEENVVANLRIAHGSPYIFASVAPAESFAVLADGFEMIEEGDNFLFFTARGKLFALFFSRNEMFVSGRNGQGVDVSVLERQAHFSLAVLPDRESLQIFKEYAFDPIIGTKVSFGLEGGKVKSRFEIVTQNNGETLLALLPKHVSAFDPESSGPQSMGKYQTIRGEQSLYRGKSFSFSRQAGHLPERLDLSAWPDADQEKLRGFVRDDARDMSIMEEDTYFLGKKLFAVANVLNIAEQLGMEDESAVLKTKLKTALEQWRINTLAGGQAKKYFYYDPVIKGIVGETASFGSERFNDHNFHYGYFIYAASILSRYDQEYLSNNQKFINLLVKDIANIDRNDMTFPYLRGFDAYAGHSWASGNGLFADGNNQESSSEAVNAWYALYLWSGVIDNQALEEAALYLYSEESSSALEYWLNINRGDSRFVNFQHTFVSLLWGGKLDSATWFSPRPEAKLAIQLLPISPGSLYLGRDKEKIREHMTSDPVLQNPTMFKDYLAMYGAFHDIAGARQRIQSLKPEDIDSANSRSFMEAWLLTLER